MDAAVVKRRVMWAVTVVVIALAAWLWLSWLLRPPPYDGWTKDEIIAHKAAEKRERTVRSSYVADQYWDGDHYVVVVEGLSSALSYCELHFVHDGRRTGEWSGEYDPDHGGTMALRHHDPGRDTTATSFLVECSR